MNEIRAPQITLFLDSSGEVHAEAPSKNGCRRKILFNTDTLPYELYSDLIDQRANEIRRAQEERERIERERIRTREKIIAYTSEHYPSALKFIIGEPGAPSRSKTRAAVKKSSASARGDSKRRASASASNLDKIIASIEL